MSKTTIIAPGIMKMHDTSQQTYLVDEELSHILINRRVWTDSETQELMIEDVSYRQKQTVVSHRLAEWWYRIMSLHDLPRDLSIGFRDGNARNMTYLNLVRLVKGDTRLVSQEVYPEPHI